MEYQKGKSQVDLTLRLGMSYDIKEDLEEMKAIGSNEKCDSPSTHGQTSNNEGLFSTPVGHVQENVELGGPSSTYVRHEVGNTVGSFTTLLTTPYEVAMTNLAFCEQGFLSRIPSQEPRGVDDAKICSLCGVKSTPLWRKGPDGPQTLCNACGLRYSRRAKKATE